MRIYIIGNDGITLCREAPATVNDGEVAVASKEELHAAPALGIGDYGVTVGAAADLFTIAASCVPEAVAAHPPRMLVFFGGNVVARDGSFLPVPVPLASEPSA
jgi:cytosine deaminase